MSEYYSVRKLLRKQAQDGLGTAIRSAFELVARRSILPPVCSWLYDREQLSLLERDALTGRHPTYRTSISDAFVADVGGGYVLTESGLALTTCGEYIGESVSPPHSVRQFVTEALVWELFHGDPSVSWHVLHQNPSAAEGRAASLPIAVPLIPRYRNYYHWMKETVPKVRLVWKSEAEADRDIRFLIPKRPPSYVPQSLRLLNVPDDRIVEATAPLYAPDRLLIPSFPPLDGRCYDWMREQIVSNAGRQIDRSTLPKCVYVSRAKAVERRVVNEREVMRMLSEFGFERYLLEDHSVAHNTVLFHNADVVVGPHGAGLTDLLFMENGSLVELFGSKVKQPYERLSDVVDLDYRSVTGRPVATDIEVPIEELRSVVAGVLG